MVDELIQGYVCLTHLSICRGPEVYHDSLRTVCAIMADAPRVLKSNQWSCDSLAVGNKNLLAIKREVDARRAELEAHNIHIYVLS